MPNSKQLKTKEEVLEIQDQEPEQKLELVSAEAPISNQEKMEQLLDKMNIVAEKIKRRNKKKANISKI